MVMDDYDVRLRRGKNTIILFIEPGLAPEALQERVKAAPLETKTAPRDWDWIKPDAQDAYTKGQQAMSLLNSRTFCGACTRVLVGHAGDGELGGSPVWLVLIVSVHAESPGTYSQLHQLQTTCLNG
jgi:hypothetical protein